jgi:hypothetical protein
MCHCLHCHMQIYCIVLGYLTTSEHQVWCVMPLKTPFGLVIRFIIDLQVVTTITYSTSARLHNYNPKMQIFHP